MAETDKLLPARAKDKLPLYQRLAFGTGHVLMVLAVAMWFNYGILFFQKFVDLSPKNAGTVVLISQVFGAIVTPFIGLWSDQCVCPIPGRRKIFHLLGTIAIACSFFFIWYDCIYCENQDQGYKTLYYTSWSCFFQLGSAVQIAQLSLIPELAKDKAAKMELNIIRYSFLVVGNLIIFVTFLILLYFLVDSIVLTEFSSKIQTMFWVMAIVVIAVGLPISMCFQLFVKENSDYDAPKLKWYKWLRTPYFYLYIGVFICGRVTVILPQSYLTLYLTDTLKMNKYSLAIGPLVLFISSGVFTTFFVKKISKFLKEKMTFFLGIVVVWASVIWIWVMDPTTDQTSIFKITRDNIYIAIILLGIGSSLMLVVGLTLVSYLIGKYIGSSAFVYGWVLFVDRLVNGVTVQIVGVVNKQDDNEYYRFVLVGILFFSTGTGLGLLIVMNLVEYIQERCKKKGRQDHEGVFDEEEKACAINDGESDVISAMSIESDQNFTGKNDNRRMSGILHQRRSQTLVVNPHPKPLEGGMTDLEASLAVTL